MPKQEDCVPKGTIMTAGDFSLIVQMSSRTSRFFVLEKPLWKDATGAS